MPPCLGNACSADTECVPVSLLDLITPIQALICIHGRFHHRIGLSGLLPRFQDLVYILHRRCAGYMPACIQGLDRQSCARIALASHHSARNV